MKKLFLILLALLITGCGSQTEAPVQTEPATAVTEIIAQTEAAVPETEPPVPQAVPTAPAYAVTQITASDGSKTVNTLDDRGNKIKTVKTGKSHEEEYVYYPDEWGYLYSTPQFMNKVISTDAAGRPVQTESYTPGETGEMELISTVIHTFHENGRLASITTIHAKSGTSYYEADEYGRATLYRYTKGDDVTQEYTVTYSASPESGNDQAKKVKNGAATVYDLTYDEHGNVVRCASGSKVWEYTYETIENPSFLVADWSIWRPDF